MWNFLDNTAEAYLIPRLNAQFSLERDIPHGTAGFCRAIVSKLILSASPFMIQSCGLYLTAFHDRAEAQQTMGIHDRVQSVEGRSL